MAGFAIAFPTGSKRRDMLRLQGWIVPEPSIGAVTRPCCACGMLLLILPRTSERLSRDGLRLFCPWCGQHRAENWKPLR